MGFLGEIIGINRIIQGWLLGRLSGIYDKCGCSDWPNRVRIARLLRGRLDKSDCSDCPNRMRIARFLGDRSEKSDCSD